MSLLQILINAEAERYQAFANAVAQHFAGHEDAKIDYAIMGSIADVVFDMIGDSWKYSGKLCQKLVRCIVCPLWDSQRMHGCSVTTHYSLYSAKTIGDLILALRSSVENLRKSAILEEHTMTLEFVKKTWIADGIPWDGHFTCDKYCIVTPCGFMTLWKVGENVYRSGTIGNVTFTGIMPEAQGSLIIGVKTWMKILSEEHDESNPVSK